jgi:fatty acid desaturase
MEAVEEKQKLRVKWYRCPVSREELRELNQRSDLKGFAQTLGYLGVLAVTGTAPIYAAYHVRYPLNIPVVIALLFLHGTCWNFLVNGFHELVHESVFKTKWLNHAFLRVFSFLGLHNHHQFWASHTEHHKYTLHPPDDLEVTLPVHHFLRQYLKIAFINIKGPYYTLKTLWRWSLGRVEGTWETALFPESEPQKRQKLFNWARFLLISHGTILVVSIIMHWWLVPVVITFAPFYGWWLQYLCNNTQHAGLQDNVPDYRLCCRTIYLNPIVQFLYWHMNYHTEHHMYAAVPCYNLGRLHRIIKADMPECPNGLIAAWKQISEIDRRQKADANYKFTPELPSSPRLDDMALAT